MKKMVLFILMVLMIGCHSEVKKKEVQQDVTSFDGPYFLTSVGQSADYIIVKSVLTKMNAEFTSNNTMTSEEMAPGVLLITTGASDKGLESAGLTFDEEMARAKKLIKDAKSQEMQIVALHFGGQERRGEKSDKLIEEVIDSADLMIVLASSDQDGYFSQTALEDEIKLYVLDSISDVNGLFEEIFK